MWKTFLTFNILYILFLFFWASDTDFKGLPSDSFSRLVALIYFTVTTLTTTGFGDITPATPTAQFVVITYMLSNFYIIVNEIGIYRNKAAEAAN
jgi:voltage-gated potassium channel Kch